MNLTLVTVGILIVILILAFRAIIHIVPEYQRLIVFRLGSVEKTAGPGIVLLLPPPIQSVAQTVDLREFVVEIPQQTCITKDNAPISIDFLIYQKVVEPKDSFLNIQNFRQAIQGIATTTLRAVVGNIPLDDVLAKREQINEELRVKLDDITHRWGVKVTNVEIKELTPPRDVQEAMNRQLAAERTARGSPRREKEIAAFQPGRVARKKRPPARPERVAAASSGRPGTAIGRTRGRAAKGE